MTTATQTITATTPIYFVRHHDVSGDAAGAEEVYGDARIAHLTREAAEECAAELAADKCWGVDDDKTAEDVGITYYVDAVEAEDIWQGPRREHDAARALGVPLLEDGTFQIGTVEEAAREILAEMIEAAS